MSLIYSCNANVRQELICFKMICIKLVLMYSFNTAENFRSHLVYRIPNKFAGSQFPLCSMGSTFMSFCCCSESVGRLKNCENILFFLTGLGCCQSCLRSAWGDLISYESLVLAAASASHDTVEPNVMETSTLYN